MTDVVDGCVDLTPLDIALDFALESIQSLLNNMKSCFESF